MLLRSKRSKLLVRISLFLLVVGFIGLQLWPTGFDRNNPPVQQEPLWDSPTTRQLAKRACFDCHSNETYWPWYSTIAPMSWMVEQDVAEGRAALNFSEWSAVQAQRIETEEVVELITKDEMPLPYYLSLHPEARLTSVEEGQLTNGLIATLEQAIAFISIASDGGNGQRNNSVKQAP